MEEIKQRYIDEATAKDITIVRNVSGTRFIFKRNGCGHLFETNISSIRHNKNTFCKQCTDEKVKESEIRLGLIFVEKIDNIRNKYILNECGHSIIAHKSNIMKNESVLCRECEHEKLLSNLEKQNMELVEYRTSDNINKCKTNKIAKVRYKSCGHEVNRFRSFKHNYGDCEICTKANKDSVYSKNGLSFVSEVSSAKSLFRFNLCGHERVLYNSAALRGNCLCQECNESPFNKKSKIYIIKIITDTGEDFIKFGYGKDIKNRIREYRMKNVSNYSLLFEKDFDSGTEAMIIEKAIHKIFKYAVLPTSYTRTYLTKGGFSECYPSNMLDNILMQLNKESSIER